MKVRYHFVINCGKAEREEDKERRLIGKSRRRRKNRSEKIK
jgi:hypothetical protein